ncbi:major facilitator superfamily domain-containing protein, partial [Bisporella sp. PMI_857]
ETKASYMSLPNKKQLAILCIVRLADPLASTSIQTYMFYQLKFFEPSISAERLATYAGIIVGAKTAAQVCTGMLWGRLADSEFGGRKAVLMIGLLSSAVASLGYGFSRTFISAVAWQVFGGAMSSTIGIARCVVAELNPEKRYRTRALLLLPLFASAGTLFGPLVGGMLSAQQTPEEEKMLKGYPYAAPNLFVASVYVVAAVCVFFGLEETLETLQHTEGSFARRLRKRLATFKSSRQTVDYLPLASEDFTPGSESPVIEMSPSNSSFPAINEPAKPTTRKKKALPFRRIWTRNVLCTMLAHFIIAGHLSTFANLWAIFLSTPLSTSPPHPPFTFTGGLGMIPREVGFAMSALGVVGVVLQLIVYPMLNDRFGTIRIWRWALFVFPFVYALAPFPSLIASYFPPKVVVWISMLFVLLLFVIGRTGVIPATTLLINDCTPHPSVRGTIHTAGTVIGNLARSFFPIIAFVIFGKGLQIGVVGLGFWCLASLGGLACVASWWVIEGGNGTEIVLEDEGEDED